MRFTIVAVAAVLAAVEAAPAPQLGVTFTGPQGGSLSLGSGGYTLKTPSGGLAHLGLDGTTFSNGNGGFHLGPDGFLANFGMLYFHPKQENFD
jgi:hypothetical protein